MTPYEIPLTSGPQRFQIAMGGSTYTLQLIWSSPASCWLLDLLTGDGSPVVTSVPMQPGVDLLSQYAYLGIPGALYVQSDGDVNKVPGFYDLGSSGHLYYVAP